MAGSPHTTCAHDAETDPGDYDDGRIGGDGTGPNVLQALEVAGKCHSRLVNPAQSGHESCLSQRARGQFSAGETPPRGARGEAGSRPLSPGLPSAPAPSAGAS